MCRHTLKPRMSRFAGPGAAAASPSPRQPSPSSPRQTPQAFATGGVRKRPVTPEMIAEKAFPLPSEDDDGFFLVAPSSLLAFQAQGGGGGSSAGIKRRRLERRPLPPPLNAHYANEDENAKQPTEMAKPAAVSPKPSQAAASAEAPEKEDETCIIESESLPLIPMLDDPALLPSAKTATATSQQQMRNRRACPTLPFRPSLAPRPVLGLPMPRLGGSRPSSSLFIPLMSEEGYNNGYVTPKKR